MINPERLHAITDGDKSMEKMLLNLFLETTERIQNKILQNESWRDAVHELKGAAANLGAETLHGLCKHLEPLEPTDAHKAMLLDEIDQTVTHVRQMML